MRVKLGQRAERFIKRHQIFPPPLINRQRLVERDPASAAAAFFKPALTSKRHQNLPHQAGRDANGQPPNKITDAMIHYLIGRQDADGGWLAHLNRPPSESSDIATTALSLRALQLYAPKGLRQEVSSRVARARQWLMHSAPRNNEDQTFQLMGLA